jgi:5'-3' exonuclease
MQAVNLPNLPASIALVDFMHMLTVHFKSTANEAGPNDAGQRTLNDLAAIRSSSAHVIVCLDSPPYWRKSVFPEYKAGREREPEFGAIVKWTVERLHADGYNVAAAPGEEADDVIASLATIYSEEYGVEDVRIVGADKDALQLVNEQVRCFVPKGRGEFEIRGPEFVKEKYGVEPKDFALMLGIMGDTSDKIPGIRGIGEVGASKLINAYKDPAGMAVACTAAVSAAQMSGKLPAFWRNYAAGMAELPKWIKLTTLNRAAQLDKHPLKYLEKLPMLKLVEDEPSDADDSGFGGAFGEPADLMTPEEMEEERRLMDATRAELAASLPVDPPKPPARDQRQEAPENAARIEAGNAAERARPAARELDRHGVKRPDASVMDHVELNDELRKICATDLVYRAPETLSATQRVLVAAWSAEIDARVPPESQATIRKLGEQLGKEGAAHNAAPVVSAGAAPATTTAHASASTAEVVPPTQGPQRQPRKADALEEPAMQAIVPYAAPSWMLSTQPASAGQAFAIAVKLHNSRRWIGRHDNPEQIAAVILRGRELGIGMMTALDAFHVIKGKVCASSQLISALAENDPNHEYTMLVELDEKHALVEIKHKKQPKPVQWSYTVDEAAVLGLLAPSPKTGEPSQWVKRPKTMLAKTAKANGHRFMFPGSTLGLHSLETEVDGQEHVGNDD